MIYSLWGILCSLEVFVFYQTTDSPQKKNQYPLLCGSHTVFPWQSELSVQTHILSLLFSSVRVAITSSRFVTLHLWLHAFGLQAEPTQPSLLRGIVALQSAQPWAPDIVPSCQDAQHKCTDIFYFLLSPPGLRQRQQSESVAFTSPQTPERAIGATLPRRLGPAGSRNSFRRAEHCASVSAVKSEKTEGLLMTA